MYWPLWYFLLCSRIDYKDLCNWAISRSKRSIIKFLFNLVGKLKRFKDGCVVFGVVIHITLKGCVNNLLYKSIDTRNKLTNIIISQLLSILMSSRFCNSFRTHVFILEIIVTIINGF